MGVRGKQPSNNEFAPQFPAGAPPKPEGMRFAASKHWDYLVAILEPANVLNVSHGTMLELMCEDYADIVRYRETMKEWEFTGKMPTVKGAKGNSVIHPIVRLLEKAQASYDRRAAAFGMTPMSINRVKVSKRKRVVDEQDEQAATASSGIEEFEMDDVEAEILDSVKKLKAEQAKEVSNEN